MEVDEVAHVLVEEAVIVFNRAVRAKAAADKAAFDEALAAAEAATAAAMAGGR